MLSDLRYALRTLARSPVFAFVTVLTLALGIGANTAIFSVVNAVLLRPLPYAASDRLVEVFTRGLGPKSRFSVSYPDLQDLRALKRDFTDVAGYTSQRYNMTGADEPREVRAVLATASLFPLLGTQPVLGRVFGQTEEHAPVLVLGYGLWAASYGRDPSVLGRTITLDDKSYTVIGVMPPDFHFPDAETQMWAPIGAALDADPQLVTNRGFKAFNALGRLAPGATVQGAAADLDVLGKRLASETPRMGGRVRVEVHGGPPSGGLPMARRAPLEGGFVLHQLRDDVVGNVRPALLVLLGAVGLVLLIACVNAANLLLARASARRREIAVRQALGAGRARIVRQLLTESLVISVAAGSAGLVLGFAGLKVLLRLAPASLPRAHEIGVDWRVLAFTLGLAVLTGVAFGLVPALRASSASVEESLRDDAAASVGARRGRRAQGVLIVGELALALVLLVGAGLLVRSFIRLNDVQPGFDTSNVLAARIRLTPDRYASPAAQQAFFHAVVDRLRQRPGVVDASLSRTLPLSGSLMMLGMDPRRVRPDDPEQMLVMGFGAVGPTFFSTLRIPLRAGRAFMPEDGEGAAKVAIVNEQLARRLWPGESPLWKTIPIAGPAGPQGEATVVGEIGDLHYTSLDAPVQPELYLPEAQSSAASQMWVIVRADREPLRLAAALRDAVRQVDGQQPIGEIVSLEQLIARQTAARRLNMSLITLFAGLAMALAAIGIYGVTAYAVAQRTREFGIRVALGARPLDVIRMLVREQAAVVAAGVVVGSLAALGLTRVLSSMLFGVKATDPATFVATALLLVLVAVAATLVPARRATRVDPMVALRTE